MINGGKWGKDFGEGGEENKMKGGGHLSEAQRAFIFFDTSCYCITIWHQDCIETEQAYEDAVTDQYVKEPIIVT